jgi:hypothetical protein
MIRRGGWPIRLLRRCSSALFFVIGLLLAVYLNCCNPPHKSTLPTLLPTRTNIQLRVELDRPCAAISVGTAVLSGPEMPSWGAHFRAGDGAAPCVTLSSHPWLCRADTQGIPHALAVVGRAVSKSNGDTAKTVAIALLPYSTWLADEHWQKALFTFQITLERRSALHITIKERQYIREIKGAPRTSQKSQVPSVLPF